MSAEFSSPMRDRIVAMYGTDMLHKSIISIRGGAGVLPALLGGGQFKTVLEIGTYRGVGAAEISQYVDRVITIDLKHGKLERLGEKHDRHAFWRAVGADNVEFIAVEDDEEKAHIVRRLEFDFALIDGAHDHTVRNDFALVRRCGNVLFHDFDRRGRRELDYVIDFIETLPPHQLTPMDIFCMWRNG